MTLVDKKFSVNYSDPFSSVEWEYRDAVITGSDGTVVFKQKNVEVPKQWSQLALNIVASKYFAGKQGTPQRETSVRDMINRVAKKITEEGVKAGYFDDAVNYKDKANHWELKDEGILHHKVYGANIFYKELCYILVNQMASFNSPVWFNIGVPDRKQQASACFILSVDDTIEGILNWIVEEGMIFKGGSGSGVNLSNLRGSQESLSAGGKASGPVSFMRGADASAGAIKSGGTTRRSAKMCILDVDHPDIMEFIKCKSIEEMKAWALGEQGYDMSFGGEAWSSIQFQNANNSVRVSNAFMEAAINDNTYPLVNRSTDKANPDKLNASDVLRDISEATWLCGDPGIQYDDTCNYWHTLPNTGRQRGSNPCCVIGETLIDTSEGKITIKSLLDMNKEDLPMVFGYDTKSELPALKNINKVWVAGETKQLIRITTDKGITVECTPEHRFLLRNGEYIEAEDLQVGDRLRKIGRWVNERRSDRHYINHRETPRSPNGTVIQSRFMYEQAFGPIPEGMEVHHTNEDPTDDRLSNLELVIKKDHRVHHATGENNNRFIQCSDAQLLIAWEALELIYGTAPNPRRWNTYLNEHGLQGIIPTAGTYKIRGVYWNEFIDYMEDVKSLVNDRVVSVTLVELTAPVAVYDMEVDGIRNFAVASKDSVHSIVIHNSEYLSVDNSACNLASLNLIKFTSELGDIDIAKFVHAIQVLITAQDILVGFSHYPTEKITRNALAQRQLGLGYANLGALLMTKGYAYDSGEGRSLAAAVTSLMTGVAYEQGTKIAKLLGSFTDLEVNKEAYSIVMSRHLDAAYGLLYEGPLKEESTKYWRSVVTKAQYGIARNAQATVLAPTGTIGFMMDCQTTGIEPAIALVSYKTMVGGGYQKLVIDTVTEALYNLDYEDDQAMRIIQYIKQHDTIEGSELAEEDLPIFDCAFKAQNGKRSISPAGHINMMGAVQPFLSGAISKTVNLPEDCTVQDITDAYILAWKQGVKAVAIYRDGSKRTQPLTTKKEQVSIDAVNTTAVTAETVETVFVPSRRRLPKTRVSVTHHFDIAGHDGYITVGLYEDGSPGEVFVNMAKQGSTLGGLMDSFAITMSIGLQYGVPIEVYIHKLAHMRFEPSGFTGYKEIPNAKSLIDYVAKFLASQFMSYEDAEAIGVKLIQPESESSAPIFATQSPLSLMNDDEFEEWLEERGEVTEDDLEAMFESEVSPVGTVVQVGPRRSKNNSGIANDSSDAPPCSNCGSQTVRAGSCYTCPNCGTTTGCS